MENISKNDIIAECAWEIDSIIVRLDGKYFDLSYMEAKRLYEHLGKALKYYEHFEESLHKLNV